MPKKSSKSKSKRLTLRHKHKILKKVKEHHKKKRKEERQKENSKAGKKEPFGKDPGIPSQWPFKEELIKEMAWKKQQILLEEKNKKEERKRQRMEASTKASMDVEESDVSRLAAMQNAAARKQSEFESRKQLKGQGHINSDADKTRRAFYKEYKKVAEAADVIIQVLDARDPLACRCLDIEKHIRSINPSKRILLLLNKIDLVPRDVVEQWLKYLRQELPTVAFKCSTQEQASNISQKPSRGVKGPGGKKGSSAAAAPTPAGSTSGCLGADTLLQLLKNYTRNAGIKTSITVGVVGLPNVGKSSLINSLKRTRVAQVGNTPGVTRAVQEVHLDKNIKLLDSPGVVFSSAESDAVAALRNAIKVESLPDPVSPVSEILKRVPAKQLMMVYKIPAFKDTDHFLQLIAAARGKLKKGGTPDCPAAARIVLQDWNNGRIPFYTLPPAMTDTRVDEAQIVHGWAKEFDVDQVFADEQRVLVEHLPAADEKLGPDGATFFEAQSLGGANVQLQDMDHDDDADEDDESDEGDAMDDDDGAPPAKKQATGTANGQVAQLYNEPGQFNPHAARAEKKRQKKLKAIGMPDDDSDFDFEEANGEFKYKEGEEGGEEEEEEDDEAEEDGEEAASGEEDDDEDGGENEDDGEEVAEMEGSDLE